MYLVKWLYLMSRVGTMFKSFALLSILVVAAPSLAVAADNQNNNSNSQNSNGRPFTANDPPAANFNSKGLPPGFPPVPGCKVGYPDDRNGPTSDAHNPRHGHPHC